VHRLALLSFAWVVACRPTSGPAPLAPDGDGAGPPATAPSPAEEPELAPDDEAAAPSIAAICEAYAKGYCEPGDASPAAIRAEQREFIALDCRSKLLEHGDANAAVMRCVESTKDCGAMGECLP
jgi:hypothetical protein